MQARVDRDLRRVIPMEGAMHNQAARHKEAVPRESRRAVASFEMGLGALDATRHRAHGTHVDERT